ncbi:site-specific DNA-methyltransferase [Amycolatopsis sp. NPDC024027]|uniref:DNA-methyltransferase n=1 Tax=Amycolatopsis sp. NPDC024027 TaxID=3154327 RepID=UPI0033E2D5BB
MTLTPDQFVRHILIGDVRERLAQLPDASVDCVITSPPYWALRDYGHSGQIGAEPTVDDWAEAITAVCNELARVLTPTGSLWLNLGDGFSRHEREGAAKKSLLLGPQRVALRLTASGWLLRNQIIWAKPNPTPSSVRDRFTASHELLFLLTRQPRYFFDLDPVREPAQTAPAGSARTPARTYLSRDAVPSLNGGTSPRVDLNQGLAQMKTTGLASHPLGKSPGDVWTIPTGSYRGAHFATFPLALVRRPLLTTCPERVCAVCDLPWRRTLQTVNGRQLATGPLAPSCPHQQFRRGRVLDPFLGAGTVAVAAETYGRDWVGIELNEAYAVLAEARLTAHRAQAAKVA